MTGSTGPRDIARRPSPTASVIDRSSGDPPNVLAEFLRNEARPLSTVPVRLSGWVASSLWTLVVANGAAVSWLLAVHVGSASCSGPVCTVVTLGDRPLLQLLLSVCCVAVLIVAAPVTGGLSSTNGPQMAVIVAGAACGMTALAGLAVVAAVAALCLAVPFTAFVVVVDRL